MDTDPRRDPEPKSATLSEAAREIETQVPEGETGPACVDPLPRARVLHNNIIRLIRAVHGRFG